MNVSVAQHRRMLWKPGKPCAHATLDSESAFGPPTGRFVCVACGESFSAKQADALRERNLP